LDGLGHPALIHLGLICRFTGAMWRVRSLMRLPRPVATGLVTGALGHLTQILTHPS
jgi:hypothetical protein